MDASADAPAAAHSSAAAAEPAAPADADDADDVRAKVVPDDAAAKGAVISDADVCGSALEPRCL